MDRPSRKEDTMKWRQSILITVVSVVAVGCAIQALAQGKPEEREQILKMSQVPQKVQQAIKAYASAAEIKQITKGDVDGTTAFEAVIEKGGKQTEISVTPDGKIVDTETIKH
jgi:hypothetical protein